MHLQVYEVERTEEKRKKQGIQQVKKKRLEEILNEEEDEQLIDRSNKGKSSFATQNETILHSKAARFLRLNPLSYPYGRVSTGKAPLQYQEDPWAKLKPAQTDHSLFEQLQQIAPSSSSMRSQRQAATPVQFSKSKSTNSNRKPIQLQQNHPKQESTKDTQKKERIIITESTLYKPIYFAQTESPHLLKQVNIPNTIKIIDMAESSTQVAFQVVAKAFREIPLSLFNLIVCGKMNSSAFTIFIQDAVEMPFSKCCNSPVQVELLEQGTGMFVCNNEDCHDSILGQFPISFENCAKLWKEKTVFRMAQIQDGKMRARISSLISNGKYRHSSLEQQMNKGSKDISRIFFEQTKSTGSRLQKSRANSTFQQNRTTDSLFITENISRLQASKKTKKEPVVEDIEDTIRRELEDTSGMQQLTSQLSEGLVQNSAVFNKSFYRFLTSNQPYFPSVVAKEKSSNNNRLMSLLDSQRQLEEQESNLYFNETQFNGNGKE